MISWLFEIGSLRLSTKNVTWSSTEYSGVIITDSFTGISLRWNIAGNGLIAPNEMEFEISNPDGTYSVSSFEDEFCIVRLVVDEVEVRTWKFKIERALSYYGKIKCYCADFLQEHLTGEYPNTISPKEIWPTSNEDDEDDYCVPVVLNTAYVPVMSVNTDPDRYYVLGNSGPTYTVYEVSSPHSWPNSSTWDSSEYDMDLSTDSGYQLLQAIISDSDMNGIADANGLWKSGDTFYNMLCQFSRSDTSSISNPADWIEYVLEDFGVNSSDIDSSGSFASASSTYNGYSIDFYGGWWKKESKESVLSNLLAQTDSYLKCTDKIELYQFSKTPVETITDVLLLSFSPSKITKSTNDSGRTHWPEAVTKPMDVFNGTTVTPTHGSGTTDKPSSDILECRFLAGQSQSAQKAGILYFQKKYEQSQRINFSVTLTSLINQGSLSPGQVVTVSNTLYGGTNNVIITDMTINPDMKVDFTGVILNYLESWGDLSPAVIPIIEDDPDGLGGIGSRSVELTADTFVIDYDLDGVTPDPSSIAFTATARNTAGIVYYRFLVDGEQVQHTTSSSYEYTPENSYADMPQTLRVEIREDGASEDVVAMAQVSILGNKLVESGSDGSDGINGTDGITVILSNPSVTIPFDGDNVALDGAYDNSGTTLKVYEGDTLLTYDGVGTADGTWKVTVTNTNITCGSLTDSGSFLTVANASGMGATTASIKFTITGKRLDGTSLGSIDAVQSFSKAKYGSRSGSIFTFEESTNTAVSASDAASWAGTLTLTAARNIAAAVMASSEDAYIRPNDRITVTDTSAEKAGTRVYTGISKFSSSSVSTSDFSSLVTEFFDGSVIVDGTLSADKLAANTTLTNNLIVGSYMRLNNSGAIFTENKLTYTDTDAGFFLGYDSTAHKLNIGNSTDYLKWDGSSLSIAGVISISNEADVRTQLNVADGADVTSANTAYDTARVNGIAAATVLSDIATAQSAANNAQATADGKVTTFYQSSQPTAEGVGDLWVDTDDNNKAYRWSGSSWITIQDQQIQTALSNAATAQSTADGKIVSFYQTTAPTGSAIGDLWFDTDASNTPYWWTGSVWQSVANPTSWANVGDPAGTKPADGADVTSLNTAASIAGQGYLATQSYVDYGSRVTGTKPPSNADNTTTTINGGVITTGYIRDSASNMVIDFSNATITVNSADGLIIDSSAGIKVTQDSSIQFESNSVEAFAITPVFESGYKALWIQNLSPTAGNLQFGSLYPNGEFRDITSYAYNAVVFYIDGTPYRWTPTEFYTVGTATLGKASSPWDKIYGNNFYIGNSCYLYKSIGNDPMWYTGSTHKTLTYTDHTHSEYASASHGHTSLAGDLVLNGHFELSSYTHKILFGDSTHYLYRNGTSDIWWYDGSNAYQLDKPTSLYNSSQAVLNAGVSYISSFSSFRPNFSNSYYLGTSTYYWSNVYANGLWYKTGGVFDFYDDLEEISKFTTLKNKNGTDVVGTDGVPVYDPLSIPESLTNLNELSMKYGISKQDLKDIGEEKKPPIFVDIEEEDNKQGKAIKKVKKQISKQTIYDELFYDASKMTWFGIGATKQLNNETTDILEDLNALIENLTSRIIDLEAHQSKVTEA